MSRYVKISIPLDKVEVGMITADVVHVVNDRGVSMTLVRSKVAITDRILDRMHRHNVERVMIYADANQAAAFAALEEEPSLAAPTPQPETAPEEDQPPPMPRPKTLIDDTLREYAVNSIRDMFDLAQTGMDSNANMTTAFQAVKEVDTAVSQLVQTLAGESSGLIHINDIKSYDEYTYHHSLSVAVLSIAIGQVFGFSDDELKKLGRCAILHDIGKIYIPHEIVNKPRRLTAEEFNIVKEHSKSGAQYLKHNNIGDVELWTGVLCHHEKMDGSGYPAGLKGATIPLYSRIISVADVYDALTSYRSYRMPLVPSEALDMLVRDTHTSFELDIVQAFTQKLELYPVNTCVELSNTQTGVVVDNSNSRRPLLRMLHDDSMLDLSETKHNILSIQRVLDSAVLPKAI